MEQGSPAQTSSLPRQLDDNIVSLFRGEAPSSSHDLLLSLSQVLHAIQSDPTHVIPVIKEELLPLLSLSAPKGVSSLLTVWKEAFQRKAAEPSGYSDNEDTQLNVQIAIATVRLLRNVVGGDERLQNVVFDKVAGEVLALLRLGSSLAFVGDPEVQPLLRSLVQLLSNLVTLNKPLQKSLFYKLRLTPTAPATPASASSSSASPVERITVIQNLLSSPDGGTIEAVQILLLNCIKTSATNSSGLAVSAGGRRLLGQLLGLFEAAVADEDDDTGTTDDVGLAALTIDEEEEEEESEGLEDVHDDEEEHATGQMDDFSGDEMESREPSPMKPSVVTPAESLSRQGSLKQAIAAESNGKPIQPGKKARRQRRTMRGEAQKSNGERIPMTIGYAIFAHLFSIGLFRHMYSNLGPMASSGPSESADGPLITTEQTLLLKTLDAWINAGGQHHPMDDLSSIDQFKNLPDEFVRLSRFVRSFITDFDKMENEVKTNGGANAHPNGTEVDRRVVGVHQALVLVVEVLVQLGMIGCEGLEEDEQFREESEEILRRMRGASASIRDGQEDLDVVAEILLLLQATMAFAPPVSPFTSTLSSSNRPVPEGHAPTSTGLGLGSSSSSSSPLASSKPRLDNLQRTLIQLLGVLVFVHSPTSLPQSFQERSRGENEEERRSVRRVQDRVRELGGLASVLGCTRIDERNPYIREHAIFTLRYLLQDNHDNQEYISKLQPIAGQ